jgi:DNA mismatch endonuclease (patch repair protein)
MTDKLSKTRRSANMRAVRSQDTRPELCVRQVAHALGYRFRLHRSELPGKPDVVFVKKRKAIFVHGCFWHQHEGCKRASMPQSNVAFWRIKMARNVARDADQLRSLMAVGWTALVVWECETKDKLKLAKRLSRFLK